MKKRWLSLFVENNIGVLTKISGLFAAKGYNVESLTVGTTEDISISRMTICLLSTDIVFEQIKKQLNRSIDIIKVMDFSECEVEVKELMFVKIKFKDDNEEAEIMEVIQNYQTKVTKTDDNYFIIEVSAPPIINQEIIQKLQKIARIELVRGGAVAIEL